VLPDIDVAQHLLVPVGKMFFFLFPFSFQFIIDFGFQLYCFLIYSSLLLSVYVAPIRERYYCTQIKYETTYIYIIELYIYVHTHYIYKNIQVIKCSAAG
jgi:hypothetical protein